MESAALSVVEAGLGSGASESERSGVARRSATELDGATGGTADGSREWTNAEYSCSARSLA